MDYDEIEALRRNSAAWRLLRADNAPLVLSFLGRVFVDENVRTISAADLVSKLDDELFALHERLGPDIYPKAAKTYLDDWAKPETGWLRKFYPPDSDEPHFDAAPAVEKALSWVASMRARPFVGTESRLNTLFDLLRQMAFGTETDPKVRLAQLYQQREVLDAEITKVTGGRVDVLDPVAQRDRYQQFTGMARELLADFREVESNFRALDRELRERIAGWQGSRGELLADVVGNRQLITDSDQGRSFQAFYDFLLSQDRQAEFMDLLSRVQRLPGVGAVDPRMRRIHYDWLDACERTQATVRLLSEQLRRFLDEQVLMENRRVMEILRGIESSALALRGEPSVPVVVELDELAPTIVLPMERPLYSPKEKPIIDSGHVEIGRDDLDTSPLFEQVYVDPARLARNVESALRRSAQIGLGELLDRQPLAQGLAELVTYLSLTGPAFEVLFDDRDTELVSWQDTADRTRTATVPRVTFVRTAPMLSVVTGDG